MPSTVAVSNPFPAEAVATYGTARITCDGLTYMSEVREELSRYLTAYARDDARYGGAIGLRGDHGSGKTHVLGWLADTLRGTKSIRGRVLYAKCDSSRLFDLYHQIMEQLDRSSVIELIQLALLQLAREKVRSAKVTESLADRLATAGSLQVLQGEQNLDLEQLRQQLCSELQGTQPNDFARLLLDVPSSTIGPDAHRWVTANEVTDLTPLGITHQLRGLPLDGSVDAERTAVMALEKIATLHRIARVPLLVLVDQLEVLLRAPDQAGLESLGSLLKKFVEQLGVQSAMVFIAGVPQAWRKLPRDVAARFRRREELVVGSLSLQETRVFLESYTHGKEFKPFSESAVATIHELSGGSPREILRIAHHAFEKANGDVAHADDDLLLESARKSGSIGDRANLVLTTVDSVFPEFGLSSRDLAVADRVVVDRVLLGDAGEVMVALVVVKATDPLDEIDSARRVQSVHRYREDHWTRADLLVVTVGYSSAEVRDLLGGTAAPIVFNEKTFEGELRARLLALVRHFKEVPLATASSAASSESKLMESVAAIENRLKQLEERRIQEAARVQERFIHEAGELGQPANEERKLATRREVLDALETLETALAHGAVRDEQRVVRSILVANEAYLHNSMLDELGELYLEMIGLERFGDSERLGLRKERYDLIRGMHESLRRHSGLRALVGRSRSVAFLMVGLLSLFVLTGIISSYTHGEPGGGRRLLFLPYPDDFITVLPFVFLGLTAVVGYLWFGLSHLDRARRKKYRERSFSLRAKVQDYPMPEQSLLRRYPQA